VAEKKKNPYFNRSKLQSKKNWRILDQQHHKPASLSEPDCTACSQQNLAALQNHDKFKGMYLRIAVQIDVRTTSLPHSTYTTMTRQASMTSDMACLSVIANVSTRFRTTTPICVSSYVGFRRWMKMRRDDDVTTPRPGLDVPIAAF
jgi:hypothetical protein